jgi:hypothetical protein
MCGLPGVDPVRHFEEKLSKNALFKQQNSQKRNKKILRLVKRLTGLTLFCFSDKIIIDPETG